MSATDSYDASTSTSSTASSYDGGDGPSTPPSPIGATSSANSTDSCSTHHYSNRHSDESIEVKDFRFTKDEIAQFKRDGYIVVQAADYWSRSELKEVVSQVDSMDAWPEKKGEYWQYFEKALKDVPETNTKKGDRLLCRVEKFLEHNEQLNAMINGEKFLDTVGQLFGEPAVMYKEKINYKLPGADGFTPHQDHAAGWWLYKQTLHISALISIDASNAENGCLELVKGRHKEGLFGAQWKGIPNDVVTSMKWEQAPTSPGTIVFFDSYVPHRSAPNPTNLPRRIMYLTYAKLAEGDHRLSYYHDKFLNYPPDVEREAGKVYEYKI